MKASLHWADGRVEDVRDIDENVDVVVREGVSGTRHFWRTDDVDADGSIVFVEEIEHEHD